MLPELAVFEGSLAAVSGAGFSLPLTDAESSLRRLTIDAADVKILRACGQLVKALVHTANTFDTKVPVQSLLSLYDGENLNAETVVAAAATLLNRRAPDERAAAKAAFKAANALYQPAWTAMNNRATPEEHDPSFLFYIPAAGDLLTPGQTGDANDAALSLDGPVTWDGTTVNLSALVTTPSSLRSLLPKLKRNKALPNTAPDPTFAGALPAATQAIANQFLKNNRLLHDVSSYLAWMDAYLGSQAPEDQAPSADSDGDGFDNFSEYVFDLNPEALSTASEFQASAVVPNPANGNLPHFTYSYIRLTAAAPVAYQVLVSDNLVTWDATGAQLETAAAPILQPDGVSERITLRLKQPIALAPKKYLKIKATPIP